MQPPEILRSYRSWWGLAVICAIAGPLLLWMPNLQPPWPEGSHVIAAVLAIVAGILSILIARYFLSNRSKPARARRPMFALGIGAAAAVTGLVCGVYYLILFNRHVIVDSQTINGEERQIRIVIGAELRGDLDNPGERPLQLLQEHGYEPERIWTRASIVSARLLIFGDFVAAFVFLTTGLALLATISSGRAQARGALLAAQPSAASTPAALPEASSIWRWIRRPTRIFLSYASERRKVAEEIFLRLTGAGYEVFFADQHAQPGTSFDVHISRSVSECDVMVFLISRESVAPDHFCLTELNRARRRWSHPDGHVLPVNLDETPHERIPAYLTAVTVMAPVGNLASDVVDAMQALRPPGIWIVRNAAFASVVLFIVAAAALYFVWSA